MRVIDLALKDLLQIVRDWKAAFFLVIMPIAFTLLFGFAFGGFGDGEPADARLPIGFLDQDGGALSPFLIALLEESEVIRIEQVKANIADLEGRVEDGELAAAVIVPAGYGEQMVGGHLVPLTVIVDSASSAGFTVEGEIRAFAMRMSSALRTARLSANVYEQQVGFDGPAARLDYFDETLARAVAAWEVSPIAVTTTKSAALEAENAGPGIGDDSDENPFAQSSPGMMAQFAIAGLMGAAAVLVLERKNHCLQRLLTTAISRAEILLGHYLAMFIMIFVQLVILVLFGQLFLRLDYLGAPLATLVMAFATALFTASLGLLIGALAKTQEQVIVFSLIPMFVLAGLGGAWVPLEITPESFQRIARLTPVAWIMDGFQDILVRGLGLEAILLSAAIVLAYAAVLFALAVWQFRFE